MRISAILGCAALLLCAGLGRAQQEEKKPSDQPPVRLNVMNVCTPTAAEQKEIAAALDRIPPHPQLGTDFEVARGRTTLPDSSSSRWVRVRHDFPSAAALANAQYSFSADPQQLVETLVVRPRDSKDILQVSIAAEVSAGQSASAVLSTDTPPDRIKVERFGKPSLGLDRCPSADQSAYEPLFRRAASIMTGYRVALGVRRLVPEELARLEPPRRAPARKSVPHKK